MKKLILGLLVSVFTLPAFADNNFTAELLVGNGDQKYSGEAGDSMSGDDMTYGIRGGYNLNQYVGFELAYQDYGSIDRSASEEDFTVKQEVSSSAFNLGAKGTYPFPYGISVHGRVGVSFWNYEDELSGTGLEGAKVTDDDNGNDYYYGLGVQYDITPRFVAGLEYSVLKMNASVFNESVDHDVNNLALTFGYNF